MSIAPHETLTRTGIVIADPDQGTLVVVVHLSFPTWQVEVFEPFEDGTEGGHNLPGFVARWEAWKRTDEPWFEFTEPRFGFPEVFSRSAVEFVTRISTGYHRREDVRAAVRSPLVGAVPVLAGVPIIQRT